MIKICFITTGFGKTGGGISRMVTLLSDYFVSAGNEVSIIFLFKAQPLFTLDQRVQCFQPKLDRSTSNRYFYAIRIAPFVRKTLKYIDPDVIIGFGEWFNPYTMIVTRGLGYPVILTDRMSPSMEMGFPLDFFKNILYRFSNGIIAQTIVSAEEIKKRTKARNIVILPNPVNTIEKSNCVQKKSIVSVGRLSKEKGHKFLIEAFSKIRDKSWVLNIIGEGCERDSLQNMANNMEVAERVIFHGAKREFSLLLSEAQIFILPSLSEGFPNALLEAMSVPLACISSNCIAGPSEIIENGKNGLLVETGNVDELVDAIELLISDESLRNKLANEAYKVREKYCLEKVCQQYLDFINQNIN